MSTRRKTDFERERLLLEFFEQLDKPDKFEKLLFEQEIKQNLKDELRNLIDVY